MRLFGHEKMKEATLEDIEIESGETVTVYQVPYRNFQQHCLSANTAANSDCTGLRLYAGGYMGICFMRYISELGVVPSNASIAELGCGTGLCGLLGCRNMQLRRLVLTDGNEKSLYLAEKNAKHLDITCGSCNVTTELLPWGDVERIAMLKVNDTASEAIDDKLSSVSCTFDLVIGFELMYYRTDLEQLLSTVILLTNNSQDSSCGLFCHAHIFRHPQQATQLNSILFDRYGWRTLEVPYSSILCEQLASHHPDWLQVRCLISGHTSRIEPLLLKYKDSPHNWVEFHEEPPDIDCLEHVQKSDTIISFFN